MIGSPGQRNDIAFAHKLIDGIEADTTLGDKGYDADHLHNKIADNGSTIVIPTSSQSSASGCCLRIAPPDPTVFRLATGLTLARSWAAFAVMLFGAARWRGGGASWRSTLQFHAFLPQFEADGCLLLDHARHGLR